MPMKKIPLLVLASALAAITAARAETVILDDTFGSGSTLNNASPADPDGASTAYQLLSSKNWSGQSVGANLLRIGMVATSSGLMECQALFTTNPVSLVNVNDSIQLRITFTNTAGLLSGTSQLGFGLYNSGGVNGSVKPVPGGLQSLLVNNQTGATTGNAQNWKGYFGQILPSGGNNRIATRDAQTGASNQNQAAATSGTSSSPGNPAPVNVGANVVSTLSFTVGAVYTELLSITKNADGNLAITNVLYSGPEPSGIALSTVGGIATNATSTYLTATFDSLGIGWRAAAATTMDVSKLTVIKYTQADLPALYNLQLNGWTNNTYSGAAQIGSLGDLWNNPDWTGVYSGSTTLFSGVTLLDSASNNYGATVTMTAAYDNNTTDWNTGVFNHYTGQTAGSATPVLMDQVVKVDYSGSVNVMTLTFAGLPPNKLATVYFYGAGNGSGQGGQWSLNGGPAVKIAYDGSATGRDVTLASSKGISWDILSGTTDGSGNLTITATGPAGGNPWWQTYMNGLQLQIGGTAPTILGLANQTVEDGVNVSLNPVVTGNPVPTYQWYENGLAISGQTSPSLTLTNVSTSQNGYVYSLVAINPIGVASNSMTLAVNASVYSTMSVTAVTPANGATGICYDTPLTITFSDTVSLGTVGAVKVVDVSNPGTPVDTINSGSGLFQSRNFPGDSQTFNYPTIAISGNTVKITPHFSTLTSNKTYYVTIDPKAFKDSGGTNFVGLTDTNLWQFTTKSAPADPNNVVVNGDGSGDFVTVQGAVNSIASGTSATQRVIDIRNGDYNEIVNISGKHNVMFRGQNRTATSVGFANNNNINGGTHFRMAFKVNANDVVIDTLTITNRTAQGGSQAEALMIESGAARCIVNNAVLASRQDTILANQNSSQAYFNNTLVKGNFDYIWGGGNLFFTNCEIRTITGSSSFNVTAARTDTGASQSSSLPWANPGGTYTANGMSFVNCTFTAEPGVGAITLAGSNGTAGNNVSWSGCDFATNYVAPSASLFSGNFVFWQADNTVTNNPITFGVLTTVTSADAQLQAATNVVTWFYGWAPVLPVITPNSPVISAPTVLPDGNFQLSASGDNGFGYRVWASDDVTLTPVTSTWTQISSGTFGAGPEIISDLDATNHTQRFYQITIP